MILLDNCLMFDGVSSELHEACSIHIEDGVIREIGTSGRVSSSADVIDMGGRFVMPGLIDAHFHCYAFDLSATVIDRNTPQLRALHAKVILEATLRRGFTTIRDAAGGDISLARALQLGLIDGPRLFYPGLSMTQTGGHGDIRPPDYHGPYSGGSCPCATCWAFGLVVDGADEMRKGVREQLRQGATQIKLNVSGGVLSPSDPYWMNQFNDEEIRVAVEEAATRRTYVMAHALTNEAVIRCLKNGVRSIEHATILAADGARAIVEHNAFVVPTLSIGAAIVAAGPALGLSPDSFAKATEVVQHALNSLDLVRQAGAQIGFGTDLIGSLMDLQLGEFRLRREVCQPIEILRSVTSVNAALLQMEGKLGTIAVGAHADLLAIDGNPLQDILVMEQPERFAMIMRAGKIIKNAML
jgi:imidazolonepropionase-like amidohydrolase